MERRQTPRQQTGLPAVMTMLSEPPVEMGVWLEDLSGAGARVRITGRVETGAVVQLAFEDALYLGEIMYCTESVDSTYAGVALRHSLREMKSLSALMRRLMPGTRHVDSVLS